MSRYLFASYPTAEIENLMKQPPHYKPRGGGIRAFDETNSDIDRQSHRKRIEAFIKAIDDQRLTERTRCLLSKRTCTPFVDSAHRKRTKQLAAVIEKDSRPEIAAAFLLSADPSIWLIVLSTMSSKRIEIGDAYGMDRNSRLLLRTAKDLYSNRLSIGLDELCSSEAVSDDMFRLIINAFVIRRYGLSLKK